MSGMCGDAPLRARRPLHSRLTAAHIRGMNAINRVPAGVPAGGQFTEGRRAESAVSLRPSALIDVVYDTSTPVPQADDLDKVATVPSLIAGGAHTAKGIGTGLGMTTRQGDYYAQAACHLGLAQADAGTGYRLTDAGHVLAEADSGERAELISAIAYDAPNVSALREQGEDGFHSFAEAGGGVGETTAQRRLQTAQAWLSQCADPDTLAARTTDTSAVAQANMAQAAAASQAKLQRRKTRTPSAPRNCPECFSEIPPAHESCRECADEA